MRIGSLFAGIGGFDLAASWLGWTTAWFSEIDPYASAVLQKHWPGVPNHGDITKIDFTQVEPVDMLCGGFPCQDISNAGKRAGIDGERSGLWREYARAIRELRPRYVVVENVAALSFRGLGRVLGDLAAIRYDAEWHVIPACSLGAPHERERCWIIAHPAHHTGLHQPYCGQATQRLLNDPPAWPACPWDAPEAGVCRMDDGIPNRVDRTSALGNAVVPQVALVIFSAIQEAEEKLRAA